MPFQVKTSLCGVDHSLMTLLVFCNFVASTHIPPSVSTLIVPYLMLRLKMYGTLCHGFLPAKACWAIVRSTLWILLLNQLMPPMEGQSLVNVTSGLMSLLDEPHFERLREEGKAKETWTPLGIS